MPTINPVQSNIPVTGPNSPETRASEDPQNRVPVDQDSAAIRQAAESNRQVVLGGRSVEFAFDDDIQRVVVTIKSKETDEVVRQIPPEDYVRFISQFREMYGIIFDELT